MCRFKHGIPKKLGKKILKLDKMNTGSWKGKKTHKTTRRGGSDTGLNHNEYDGLASSIAVPSLSNMYVIRYISIVVLVDTIESDGGDTKVTSRLYDKEITGKYDF